MFSEWAHPRVAPLRVSLSGAGHRDNGTGQGHRGIGRGPGPWESKPVRRIVTPDWAPVVSPQVRYDWALLAPTPVPPSEEVLGALGKIVFGLGVEAV